MKKMHALLSESIARPLSKLISWGIYIAILLLAIGLILSLAGKQSFTLHVGSETYYHSTFSEIDWMPEGVSFFIGDDPSVYACSISGEVDFITHIGIFMRTAAFAIPLMIGLWFFGRVFRNIGKGLIFANQNAYDLLYCGLIWIVTAIFAPFVQILISYIANLFTGSQIILSAGESHNSLISGAIMIVAAYVIRQGVSLQENKN